MELGLLVVFQTDTGDEIELGFQPVHMLLFIFQDLLEQVAVTCLWRWTPSPT